MTEEFNLLGSIADRHRPAKADGDCWDWWALLRRGIECGWVDADELQRLLDDLLAGEDPGVEELLFDYVGWEINQDRLALLQVRFLNETASCAPEKLLPRIKTVLDEYAQHADRKGAA